VGEVAFPKLLSVDVVVDVDSLLPRIAPQLLDEFARHTRSSEVDGEPFEATASREMVLHSGRSRNHAKLSFRPLVHLADSIDLEANYFKDVFDW